jgi:peptide-methionine (R)-S-oxide reductase
MSHHDDLTRAAWLRAAGITTAALLLGASAPGDDKWRKLLTPAQYAILRENGTEPPFSSPLLKEHRAGTYFCAGCALPLFSSKTKYDSGDGWPSFTAPLPAAIATRPDFELVEERTEVHCKRCAGHLGHVFDDGPPPAHLRYCIDGLALHFVPSGKA